MDPDRSLLEDIYIAHVLILAKQMKTEKAAKGVTSTSDFIDDAVREISRQKQRVLRVRSSSL